MINVMISTSILCKAERAIQEYHKGNIEMYERLKDELEKDGIII